MALIPPIYKPHPLRLKLAEKRQLNGNVFEFIFTPLEPNSLEFEPGQFINIDIPSTEKRIVRSYSISSNPMLKETIEICVKLVDGPGSKYLKELNVGDIVSGSGPFGIFSIKDDYNENMLFVATGTGIAPFKSMLGYQVERNFQSDIMILFGLRSEEDIFYDELFKGISVAQKNINYHLSLSRPSDVWPGSKGRVTELLRKYESQGDFKNGGIMDLKNLRVFICGNGDMIKEVSDMFKEMGLPEDKIHHEKFY